MSRSFTKIVSIAFALAFVLGIASKSFAQDEDKDVIRPITKSGSAAMVFELSGFGTFGFGGTSLGGFVNNAVGVRYFVSDGLAIVVLAGFNSVSGTDSIFVPSTQSAKQSTTAFGIGAGVEDHLRPLYSTSPYVGGMISFGSESFDNGESGNADEKESLSAFNVSAIAGFDWFFTRGLCLGGQVSLGFTSKSSSETAEGTTTSGQGSTTIALATGGSVHFDVYF